MNESRRFSTVKNAILAALSLPARRRNFFSTRIANICKYYLRVYENGNWNFGENGEQEVLHRLSKVPIQLIFDVGAHEGTWSKLALNYCPDAVIHAFEIAPPTAKFLQSQFDRERRLIVNPVGLGQKAEAVRIAYFPEHRDNTLILPMGQQFPPDANQLNANVITGDEYCQSMGIDKIDFCKIDVEGHDYHVLGGFKNMLSVQAIDVIQFEHLHDFSLRRAHCLEDIFSLLVSYDYRIGRLFRDGVVAQAYDRSLERLIYANYVAVSTRRADLWQRLEYR